MKMVNVTKVVTRNIIMDIVAWFQNFLGLNLTSYERMVDKGIGQCRKELKDKEVILEWYRYEITQLMNGAVVIMLYGDRK